VSSAASSVVGGSGDGEQRKGNGSRRGQFPYAYIRSRLSVLPEEQAGQLSRRESMNQGPCGEQPKGGVYRATRALVTEEEGATRQTEDGKSSHGTSFRTRQKALRRKRSLSVPDIPVPPGFEDGGGGSGDAGRGDSTRPRVVRRYEESGYDSDATRRSSPRGSLKSNLERVAAKLTSTAAAENQSKKSGRERKTSEDTDSMSSKSDDSGNVSGGSKEEVSASGDTPIKVISSVGVNNSSSQTKSRLPEGIKKPPRKSKLPEATFRQQQPSVTSGRFKKNGETETDLVEISGLPSLTNRRFKMLRLRREPGDNGDNGELGIVISKKRHPQKGTTGYVIAHIDEGGVVSR